MTAISLTRDQLIALNPCDMDQRLKLFGRRKSMNAAQALKAGASIDDLLWVAGKLGLKEQIVRFALACAQRVAHLNPDPRVQAALDATAAWIADPSEENRAAAGAAALAAWAAARAAWDAAWAARAVWAAGDAALAAGGAARVAAWAAGDAARAAGDAARAARDAWAVWAARAARDAWAVWAARAAGDAARAAGDAAWAAARAAGDAAGAAARAAAWAAEREAQITIFLEIFGDKAITGGGE